MTRFLKDMALFFLLPLTCACFRITTALARFTFHLAGKEWRHG
ncbi:hypothetical protein AA0313_2599 [Acetobacter indonesiensis NRIC 0313]|uniref:Uncharacterized protein n=1 Tax=Acetobacter indonesiensis TaxID=104101 RepID=A0A6N3T9N6_9PROT|nr:hypothetical protein [Acetobacter indonesiensis]GAN63347.1 hypothetical protein Abin_025_008 [Acetobacter indonesiensis]GBQ61099.1 hypothetical protein AA0313_2599 [Acetobacter indonesiensis NRIC 0313]GEN04868.1 hypothetical protein AIN02nite_28930 [Acetobacter indonesiensis]